MNVICPFSYNLLFTLMMLVITGGIRGEQSCFSFKIIIYFSSNYIIQICTKSQPRRYIFSLEVVPFCSLFSKDNGINYTVPYP